MSLERLSEPSIHRLCSGQVILDLASAVKELVENALDADSSTISVCFKNYGLDSISVSDNGSGITEADAPFLGCGFTAKSHHTSKIQDFGDIVAVSSFGFRGEALASLCALSDGGLCVVTAVHGDSAARKLVYDTLGTLVETTPTARSKGSTITLTNLFSALPVRRTEWARNTKREFGRAVDLLTAYALNVLGVRFTVSHITSKGDTVTLLQTQGSRILTENATSLFGLKLTKTLVGFTFQKDWAVSRGPIIIREDTEENLDEDHDERKSVAFTGFISRPAGLCGRSSPDRQYIYVNGRPCDLPKLARALNELFREYSTQKYPVLILNLSLEPGFFDVNVSPDKRTVFIQDETGLVDWLKDNMRELFEPFRQSDHIFSQKSIGVASSSGGEGNSQNYFQDSILSNFTYSSSTVEEEEETILDPEIHTDPLVQVVDVTPLEPEKEDCVATPKTHQSTLDLTTLFKFDASSKRKEPTITRCCSVSATPQGRDKSSVPSSSAASSFPDNRKKARLSLGTIKPSTRTRASVFSLIKGDLTVKCDLSSMSSSPSDRRELSEADASMHFEAGLAKDQSDLAEQELTRFIHKEDFKKMDVLGQFNLGFIIVRLGKDLFVIDQHASDEKYTFESLMKNVALSKQSLITPMPLHLTSQLEYVALQHMPWIQRNGFELRPIDPASSSQEGLYRLELTQVPQLKNMTLGSNDLEELLQKLSNGQSEPRCDRVRAWYASKACRTSVMIGMALTRTKMKTIVSHLSELEHPWNCPHGRPTMRHLYTLD